MWTTSKLRTGRHVFQRCRVQILMFRAEGGGQWASGFVVRHLIIFCLFVRAQFDSTLGSEIFVLLVKVDRLPIFVDVRKKRKFPFCAPSDRDIKWTWTGSDQALIAVQVILTD